MDSTGLVRWADVCAAEKLLDEAVAKREAMRHPDNWVGAHETLDGEGRRSTQFQDLHFELLDHANEQVARSRARVIATRRAWVGLDAGGGL